MSQSESTATSYSPTWSEIDAVIAKYSQIDIAKRMLELEHAQQDTRFQAVGFAHFDGSFKWEPGVDLEGKRLYVQSISTPWTGELGGPRDSPSDKSNSPPRTDAYQQRAEQWGVNCWDYARQPERENLELNLALGHPPADDTSVVSSTALFPDAGALKSHCIKEGVVLDTDAWYVAWKLLTSATRRISVSPGREDIEVLSDFIACEVEPKPVSSTRQIVAPGEMPLTEVQIEEIRHRCSFERHRVTHDDLNKLCDMARAALSARGSMTELIVRHAIIDWNRRHIGPGRPIPPLDIDRHQEGDLANAVLAAMRAHNDIGHTR